MKLVKAAVIVMVCTSSGFAQAALSPSSLKLRDLNTMTNFVAQHTLVAQQLKQIDVMGLTVTYGDNCVATFERAKPSIFAFRRPGPQPDIKFVRSNCPLDEQ